MILDKIKPSPQEQEHIKKISSEIISKIKIPNTKVILGGSGAKNTYLKQTRDIDIYVKFNYNKFKNKSHKISEILYKYLKKKFKVSKLHGSRDYYQIKKYGFTFEIIPILDIKNYKQAKNITDVSHLHVAYVKKHAKLADEIRLAKAFAQAQEVYGAESYIKGFSGYVLELLVIHYGSFKNLIKNASKWQHKEIIGSKKLYEKLNYSKKQSPLVLIDPIQFDRNSAAALSQEKYQKFIQSCKEYLRKSSDDFFEKKEFSIDLRQKNINLILLEVIPLKGKQDVIGSKLLKAFEFIKKQLELEGYFINECNWHWNSKAYFYYILEDFKIDPYKIHYGPYVNDKTNYEIFKKKYKNVQIDKDKCYVKIQRKYTNAKDFIKFLIKNEEITSRVKDIKIINQ
jgi:tRNA nucleotidyltransferase (CCA-adding enzyme)